MGRNRGARGGRSGGGGHPFFSTHNGGGGGASATNGFTFTDIDDEPKFVELPDDFETDSGEETTKSTTSGLLLQQMIHIFAKKNVDVMSFKVLLNYQFLKSCKNCVKFLQTCF